MRRYHETFRLWEYLLFAVVTLAVLCLCVCIGSVRVPLGDTLAFFAAKLTGGALPEGLVSSIMPIRLPRVLCVALTGAALSLAGAAMQGLLKNPLADGSTLGVSSGASLGAVCAIAFGVTLPGFPFAGTMDGDFVRVRLAAGHPRAFVQARPVALDQHDHPHRRDLLDVRLEHHEHRHHLCRR